MQCFLRFFCLFCFKTQSLYMLFHPFTQLLLLHFMCTLTIFRICTLFLFSLIVHKCTSISFFCFASTYFLLALVRCKYTCITYSNQFALKLEQKKKKLTKIHKRSMKQREKKSFLRNLDRSGEEETIRWPL